MRKPGADRSTRRYRPQIEGRPDAIDEAVDMLAAAERPILYTGGGIINSGPARQRSCCASWPAITGAPVTSTLMGLGAFPASSDAVARHARHARHL